MNTPKIHRADSSLHELMLVLILSVVQLSHILDFVLLMPLGPLLMRSLSIDVEKFSRLVSIYTLSAAISCFMASFVMDRFDRRKVILFVYGGLILGTFACGLAPTYEVLLVARTLTGVFGGLLQAIILSIISDIIPVERRGRATGFVMGAFAVSSVVGVPTGLAIANHWGWNAPFLVLGVMSLTNLFFVWAKIPSLRHHLTQHHQHSFFRDFMSIMWRRNTLVAMALMISMMTVFGMFPFVSPFLVQIVKIAEGDLPLIYLVGGLASLVTTPLIGVLSDKFGPRQVFVASTLLSMVAVSLFCRLDGGSLGLVLILNAFVSAVGVGRMTPSMELMSRSVSDKQRGGFMTFIAAIQQLAASGASYGGGVLLNGADGMAQFPLVGGIVAGSMLLSIGLCFLFRPLSKAAQRPHT